MPEKGKYFYNLINKKLLTVALLFGFSSMLVMYFSVSFYVPGTKALSDPREIFNAIGSALTGPVGALIIAFLSTLFGTDDPFYWYVLVQHLMSALWISWAYKKIAYEKFNMPSLLLCWLFLIFVYYYITYIPVYLFLYEFYRPLWESFVGGNYTFWEGTVNLYKGWTPEILFTAFITTLAVTALPANLRKPLWGKSSPILQSKRKPDRLGILYNKYFGNRYLSIRLTIWFLILFILILVFQSLQIRKYFLENFLSQESTRQLETAEYIGDKLSTSSEPDMIETVTSINKVVSSSLIVTDANLNILYPKEIKEKPDNEIFKPAKDQKEKILREKTGALIDVMNMNAVGFKFIPEKNIFVLSVSAGNKYQGELENLVLFIYENLGLTFLVVAFVSGLIIWVIVGKPLKHIIKVTEEIGRHNYNMRINHKEMTDEVAQLATAIDEMQTNIRNAHTDLIDNELKYRLLFETSNDAILLMRDGVIVDCNSKTLQLFSATYADIVKHSFHDLSPEMQSDGKISSAGIAHIFTEVMLGKMQFFEWEFLKQDGSIFIAEVIMDSIEVKDGKIIHSLVRDITERKRNYLELIKAKEDAESSNKLKSEFLAQMSHEIRSPINVILNFSALIRSEMEAKVDDDLRSGFNAINHAGKRIIRTIDLLLNMSEIQAHTYQPIYGNLNLDAFLTEKIIPEYSYMAKEKGLWFQKRAETDNCIVHCDEYTLSQIFANLLDNAIKYTEKGEVSIIISSDKDGEVVCTISDTGIGMSSEFLGKVFEPFTQEEQGYTRTYEGNGLGLALVKGYCVLNGIDISLQSVKGEGTVFSLRFRKS